MISAKASELLNLFGKHMHCNVCKEVQKVSSSLPCGHFFCASCLDSALFIGNECPTCKRMAQPRDVARLYAMDSLTSAYTRLNQFLQKKGYIETEEAEESEESPQHGECIRDNSNSSNTGIEVCDTEFHHHDLKDPEITRVPDTFCYELYDDENDTGKNDESQSQGACIGMLRVADSQVYSDLEIEIDEIDSVPINATDSPEIKEKEKERGSKRESPLKKSESKMDIEDLAPVAVGANANVVDVVQVGLGREKEEREKGKENEEDEEKEEKEETIELASGGNANVRNANDTSSNPGGECDYDMGGDVVIPIKEQDSISEVPIKEDSISEHHNHSKNKKTKKDENKIGEGSGESSIITEGKGTQEQEETASASLFSRAVIGVVDKGGPKPGPRGGASALETSNDTSNSTHTAEVEVEAEVVMNGKAHVQGVEEEEAKEISPSPEPVVAVVHLSPEIDIVPQPSVMAPTSSRQSKKSIESIKSVKSIESEVKAHTAAVRPIDRSPAIAPARGYEQPQQQHNESSNESHDGGWIVQTTSSSTKKNAKSAKKASRRNGNGKSGRRGDTSIKNHFKRVRS